MDLTSVKGRHTYKWGLGIEHDEHGGASLSYPTGLFNFARTETGQGTSLVGGDAFASFQLGLTDNASGQAGPERLYDGWYLGGYFQDDWKPTSNLTFNIGIRYDLDGPIQEVHGYGSSFCFTCMNPVSGNPGTLEFFNSANPPYTTYYNTEWRRLAPRFGFAWKFLPKTVIRGGYGIFNTRPQFGFNAAGPTAGSMTSVSQSSIDNGVTPTFLLAHGFNVPYPIGGVGLNEGYGAVAPGQAPNTVVVFIERNWKLAYLQHFNLSIERELPGGMVLEVAGQGFLDRDVATGAHNYDEIPPAYWGVPGPLLNRHAFPQFAAVYDREAQAGTINAYSGYVKLERHFANGFSLQGSYSYGRSLGLQGGDIYSSFQGNNNLQKLFYGPTTYNSNGGTNFIPQVAGINAVYQFPAGFGRTYLTTAVQPVGFSVTGKSAGL
jgi:hypothetical protein